MTSTGQEVVKREVDQLIKDVESKKIPREHFVAAVVDAYSEYGSTELPIELKSVSGGPRNDYQDFYLATFSPR